MTFYKIGKDGWPTDEVVIQQRDREIERLRLLVEEAQANEAKMRALYGELLLFAVERKFPGETRFETALRYIKCMEEQSHAATAPKSGGE